jgi:hypothetical protein
MGRENNEFSERIIFLSQKILRDSVDDQHPFTACKLFLHLPPGIQTDQNRHGNIQDDHFRL